MNQPLNFVILLDFSPDLSTLSDLSEEDAEPDSFELFDLFDLFELFGASAMRSGQLIPDAENVPANAVGFRVLEAGEVFASEDEPDNAGWTVLVGMLPTGLADAKRCAAALRAAGAGFDSGEIDSARADPAPAMVTRATSSVKRRIQRIELHPKGRGGRRDLELIR